MNDELDMVYLMAQISHEIRTPLNGIKGFGELLLDESIGQLNDVQKKYLTKMLDSTEKLSQIVERVLDWAKLESKQSQLSIEEVQLNYLLWEVVELLSQKAEQKNITLVLNAPETIILDADSGRVREIIINLVDNSLKYTPSGGRVEVTANVKEEKLLLTVKDDGYGIPPNQMKRLFQPFSYGAKRIANEVSSGLGLWICKLLVEMHQGSIWAESQEGEGSCFYVSLPLHQPA